LGLEEEIDVDKGRWIVWLDGKACCFWIDGRNVDDELWGEDRFVLLVFFEAE
jgi:hypothetical protein